MSQRVKNGLFLITLAGLAAGSHAQWVGMSIHPGGNFSAAYGASTGIAVGAAGTSLAEAGYWTNGGSTFTSVHQDGCTSSILFAGDMNMQVGGVQNPGNVHAARWFGTAASFEDMNPSRCSHSQASSMFGNEFAGWGVISDHNHALLWHGGGNDDYTDLHPDGATNSVVNAMDAGQQVGTVTRPGINQEAGYWHGTAASYTSLAPIGSTASWANAGAAGRQGGVAQFDVNMHAYLWSGTAESAIDIHPDGFESSQVDGMSANYQVGAAFFQADFFRSHAGFWSGSKNSWVDLHSFLPPEFKNSEATSVVEYADRIEVYGFAQRGNLGDDRFAVMWTQPVPEPATVAVLGLGMVGLLRRRRRS